MIDQYKNLIADFYQKNKRMPSYAEMAKLFGFKSKNAVSRVVEKMLDAGVIAKGHLGKIVPNRLFGEVPLLGSVTAGLPAYVDNEWHDTINLEEFLIHKKETTYMLEVDGDSMIDAHIEDGDMVVVERTNKAKDGDIVIAEVDGEWTMKYLRQRGEKSWLEPANKKYQPIYPENGLRVAAVVRGVVRKY